MFKNEIMILKKNLHDISVANIDLNLYSIDTHFSASKTDSLLLNWKSPKSACEVNELEEPKIGIWYIFFH